MKLYSRKLGSLEDLHEERRRLKGNPQPTETAGPEPKEEEHKDSDPEVVEVSEVDETTGHPLMDAIRQFLPGGAAGGGAALSSAMMIFDLIPGHVKKKYLRLVLKEFVGGYIAWKALQLGYKGGKILLKNYKERKKMQQLRIYP